MMENSLKDRLVAGRTVVGSLVYVPSARLTEIVALGGFDFVLIDMEHGPIDIGVAEEMVRAAELAGAAPMIRVTHNSPHLILRALDIGARGVHVPEINTAAEARRAAASCRYGPEGSRGMAGVRAAGYGFGEPLAEYAARANREVLLVAHIESKQAVDSLDELLQERGIDVFYLGPEDIANSLGIPGQSKDPRVVRLVEDGIRRVAAAGRVAGCIAADVATARRYIELGARYIATHALRFMVQGSRQFLSEVRA